MNLNCCNRIWKAYRMCTVHLRKLNYFILKIYTDDGIMRKRKLHEMHLLSHTAILVYQELLTLKLDLKNVVPVKLSAVARFKSITHLGGVGA